MTKLRTSGQLRNRSVAMSFLAQVKVHGGHRLKEMKTKHLR